MSTSQAVKIGPSFFSKAKQHYRDSEQAIIREYGQNSIDCGSRNIVVNIAQTEGEVAHTTLSWCNDGVPMTKEILCDKLLSIGESGKNFENSIGGFGESKLLILLCQRDYRIRTGNLLVYGSGGNYQLDEVLEYFYGSEFIITMDCLLANTLINEAKRFISLSQWKGTFTLNGEIIEQRLRKGRKRKDLSFGQVYSNKDYENLLVVRINNIPMFTRNLYDYKGTLVVELNGKSSDILQSSRDYLKYSYGQELDEFILNLSVNKRSALKEIPRIETIKYSGYKLKGKPKTDQSRYDLVTAGGKEYQKDSPEGHVAVALINLVKTTGGPIKNPDYYGNPELPLRPQFYLKNETGIKTSAWFTPDSFSQYSKNLIWRWMSILITLADLTNNTTPFSVGFVISEDAKGLFEDNGDDRVIYVNPIIVVRKEGKSPTLQCRWKLSGSNIWDLVACGIHEWCHHENYINHNEAYALRLSYLIALCLKERTRFAKIFQSRVDWPDMEKD